MLPDPCSLGTQQVAFLRNEMPTPTHSPSPRAWAPRLPHCSFLGACTVMGILKLLKKHLLSERTDWVSRISFSPGCSKMRGRVWQKRRRVKKWVRQATWGSSLKFIHLALAYYSSFLGQGDPCPLHTHFRNFTWCEQWNSVESPISLRISLLSIPLLEMSGSNFVIQLYLLSLC